jgi:NhaA family Na+:H+ antiporter
LAGIIAAVIVKGRDRTYRRIHERETADEDDDGIPDIYQRPGDQPPL